MGIDYFSLGSYINPQAPVDKIRPPLKTPLDEKYTSLATEKDKLTSELVSHFDTVIVMHLPQWITSNWEVIKNKRVIWRTIGQSTPQIEKTLAPYKAEGLEVCRYSPREQFIENNIGFTSLIRFYKDPKEFNNWNGGGNEVITFSQDMKHRGEHCNYTAFTKIVDGYNAKIYGPNNDNTEWLNGGMLSYEGMKQKMKDARVYIYTGTQPASYTLSFIEAMMTGIPIVAIGRKLAQSLEIAGDVYEIPDIIDNGVNGFYSDDIDELREYVRRLIKDIKLARYIGQNGREKAIQLFDKEKIKNLWRKYLLETRY